MPKLLSVYRLVYWVVAHGHAHSDTGLAPQIRGIIVENTFTSIEDLVQHLSPAFSKHMVKAMTNKWDTLSIIGSISKPMLLLSGRADEIVPPRMMTQLYKAAILSEGRELAAFPTV